MLAWGMLSFGDGYNKSDADLWAKSKETLKWNADYLLKTIKDDPFSSAKSKKPEFYIVYQVCCCSGFQLCTQGCLLDWCMNSFYVHDAKCWRICFLIAWLPLQRGARGPFMEKNQKAAPGFSFSLLWQS